MNKCSKCHFEKFMNIVIEYVKMFKYIDKISYIKNKNI